MAELDYTSKATIASNDLVFFENTYNNFSCPKHFHETFQVEIIEKGTKSCYCNGSNYNNIQKDTLVFINPGEIHTGGNTTNDKLVCRAFYPEPGAWLNIVGESFGNLQSAGLSSTRFKTPVANDNRIAGNIKTLFHLSQSDENNLLVKELYQQVMFDLMSRHMTSSISFDENFQKYDAAIKRAFEYINDNISGKLLLEDIAKSAFISPFHFLRVFKNFTGITLHQYILSLRVERAKMLLRQKSTISYTYSQVGFLNQTHFTKVFRKMTGLTPRQFKEVVRN